MDRDNETWISSLSGNGAERDTALVDLRALLLANLRRAFSGRASADGAFLEDTVQESLLRLLDRLDQFAGRSRFLTWATSIAIHVGMTELRRRRWQDVSLDEVSSDSEPFPHQAADNGPEPDIHVARRTILEAMHEVIRTGLTPKQRTALLAELKGMPLEDVARHLGSNRNAIYKLTYDARKKLKLGLETAGYHAEDIHAAFA